MISNEESVLYFCFIYCSNLIRRFPIYLKKSPSSFRPEYKSAQLSKTSSRDEKNLVSTKNCNLSNEKNNAMAGISKILIFSGIVLIVAGLAFWLLDDRLDWLGRLPGDVRIERPNFRFYFPFTTMIILSIVLTFIVNLIRRFF